MTSSAFTPTTTQNPITVVVPGVSDGLVSLNGVPGRSSGSVPTGYIGQDQTVSLTSIFTQSPASNNTWYDVSGSSITISQAGKFLLNVDVPVQLGIIGGNANSAYAVQAAIRTTGGTIIASSAYVTRAATGSVLYTEMSTVSIGGIVTATLSQQYFLSIRYFYAGGAADAGTKEIYCRADTNNFVFKAIRIA